MVKYSRRNFRITSIIDMAFLISILFILTTTMDIDTSFHKTQSSLSNQSPLEVKEQNITALQVKANDLLMNNEISLSKLQKSTKESESHIYPQNKSNHPDKKIESVEVLEKIEVSHSAITSSYSVIYPCTVSLYL